ncbi:hypothetical protein [Legionella maioricensis]|uniref:Uncharacterized protein n=1 Tax=Legionella maioricensis TaxID=2896528 RepID=A0A9X2D2D6_9GAMM|nr:hypothetical protein [Legionella maioricensis]MCL9684992.1 hypothetical protein [Legionella maioricensis]MCL9688111.1 hypothetical protein [Legionella maioricensis]
MSLRTSINQLLHTPFKTNHFMVTANQINKPYQGYVINYEYKNKLLFQLEFVDCYPEVKSEGKNIILPLKKLYMRRATVQESDFSDMSFPQDLPFRDAFSHLEHANLHHVSQKERNFRVYNYFCGPKIDDVRPGDSFTISTFGTEEIKDELSGVCKWLDVPVSFLPLETKVKNNATAAVEVEEWQWLRDVFRRLGNGALLFNEKGLSEKYFAIADSAIALNPRSGKNAFTKSVGNNEDDEAMVFGFETEGSYGSQLSVGMEPHKLQAKKLFEQAKIDIKSSKVLLEGGNTYCLTNTNGELFVVLGENSLVLTAAYRMQHQYQDPGLIEQLKKCPMPKNEFYLNLQKNNNPIQWYDLEEAKFAIVEESNIHPSQLLILPNPLFHIDMIMTQGPDGTILLHDFQLVEDTLEPILKKLRVQLKSDPSNLELRKKEAYLDSVLYQNHKLQHTLGDFISLLMKTLESNGFKVVSIPALAYQYVTNEDLFEESELDDNPRIVLNLVNGIAGQSKSGNFLIVLSSANENLKPLIAATETILKNNGVTLYTVGTPTAAASILNGHGSLRCMSFPNGVPGDLNRLLKQITPSIESSETVTRVRRRQNGFRYFRRLDPNPLSLKYLDEIIEQMNDIGKEAEQSFKDAVQLFGDQFLFLRAYNRQGQIVSTNENKRKNTEETSCESESAMPQSKSQCKYSFNGRFFVLSDKDKSSPDTKTMEQSFNFQ